jgi:hypothetical protein
LTTTHGFSYIRKVEKKDTTQVAIVKSGRVVATATGRFTNPPNEYILVWAGEWINCPPTELEHLPQKGDSQTFINALHHIAESNGLSLRIRHPQNWSNFVKSIQKVGEIIGLEIKTTKDYPASK